MAALIVLALAVLIFPLLKKPAAVSGGHRERNIGIARERLADLKRQLQDGVLDQVQFDEQYVELQGMLNDDLQAESETATKPANVGGRWIIPLLLALIPTASLFLYLLLGDANALRKAELQQNSEQAANNMVAMVEKVRQKLQQNPDDLQGWLMLGKSYSYLQQYQAAADAFAELNRRKPNDVEVIVQYANNLAMARNGQMAGEPAQLVEQALRLAADEPNALWLAGMAKVQQGEYAKAGEYWRHLLAVLPPDSETVPQVQQMLAALEQEQTKLDAPAAERVEIPVQVEIAAEMKAKFPPQTTVFVYAQAVTGPKMPLAIVRKQLSDLPVSVTLNDAVAMQGASRLADHRQLRIVARLSQSGQAMSAPGDWVGSAEISQPFGAQPVKLIIDQEIK